MGLRAIWTGAVFALAMSAGATNAFACEEYVEFDMPTMKEYRDKLKEQNADPFDRLFAFQQLVCSSNPTMRSYAVREGLRSASDPIVRQQILLDAMMQKTRLDIEMTSGGNATKADKEFIRAQAGLIALSVYYASATQGCLSLYSRSSDACSGNRGLFIRGDNVKLTYNNIVGEFFLTDANELVGFVWINDRSDRGRIPAVIMLN